MIGSDQYSPLFLPPLSSRPSQSKEAHARKDFRGSTDHCRSLPRGTFRGNRAGRPPATEGGRINQSYTSRGKTCRQAIGCNWSGTVRIKHPVDQPSSTVRGHHDGRHRDDERHPVAYAVDA